jgi:predicted small lipoprotein YifL
MVGRILVLFSLGALLVSGCGYKGPLVLPDVATTATTTTNKDDKKKTP